MPVPRCGMTWRPLFLNGTEDGDGQLSDRAQNSSDGAQLFGATENPAKKLVLHHDTTIQLSWRTPIEEPTSPDGQSRQHRPAHRAEGVPATDRSCRDPGRTDGSSSARVDFEEPPHPISRSSPEGRKPYKDDKGEMEEDLIAIIFRGQLAKMMAPRRSSATIPTISSTKIRSQREAMGRTGLRHGRQGDRTGIVLRPIDYDSGPTTRRSRRRSWTAARSGKSRPLRRQVRPRQAAQGEKAIQARLKKGQPCLVGITYIPKDAIRPGGTLAETSGGGHTVLIVGCDTAAKRFLFDPYGPDAANTADSHGSNLQYMGGMEGLDTFPDKCRYLGMFEDKDDPTADRCCARPRSRSIPATLDRPAMCRGHIRRCADLPGRREEMVVFRSLITACRSDDEISRCPSPARPTRSEDSRRCPRQRSTSRRTACTSPAAATAWWGLSREAG